MSGNSDGGGSPCLYDFVLDMHPALFATRFMCKRWTEHFLLNELQDIDVSISDWSIEPEHENAVSRIVKSSHRSNISFPGLSSHAENKKKQVFCVQQNGRRLLLLENTSFSGIPYSDYFVVNMKWVVEAHTDNLVDLTPPSSRVRIFVDVLFMKSTWLKGTIESNTKAELLTVCEQWKSAVEKDWSRDPDNSISLPADDGALSDLLSPVHKNSGSVTAVSYESEIISKVLPMPTLSRTSSRTSSGFEDDDESLYFDCVTEGLLADGTPAFSSDIDRVHQSPMESTNHSDMSYRSIVIGIVDTAFIFLEYFIWQLKFFYQDDLKYFFDINDPSEILRRAVNSMVPGSHQSILNRPDLYGTMLGVLSLPLVFLLAVDTSRNGCTRSSLLGNAVVISLCMWLALSGLYRFAAYIMTPNLKISQLICSVGYSFYSWSLALVLTILFDWLYQNGLLIHPTIPLIVVGLPSAAMQGYIFWELTAPSSLRLDSSAFPQSLRGFIDRNASWLQRLVWVVPKLFVFAVVTATHYQSMWYLARVFLPGKQQQCRLSRLIQPAVYADILTQKELIRYAGELIRTGHVPNA